LHGVDGALPLLNFTLFLVVAVNDLFIVDRLLFGHMRFGNGVFRWRIAAALCACRRRRRHVVVLDCCRVCYVTTPRVHQYIASRVLHR
jgi:hypothetical protein